MLTVLVFGFWVLLMPSSRASPRGLRACPWISICLIAPFEQILGSAAPNSPATRAKTQGTKNGAFGKQCLCPRDTRHSRHFRRFTGFEQQSPVLLVRMQIRHFRRFRQKPPLFGGTKAWVYSKSPFLGPRKTGRTAQVFATQKGAAPKFVMLRFGHPKASACKFCHLGAPT